MSGRMPEVSISNGIRVYLEGGGELFRFGCSSLPTADSEVLFTPVDGDPVTYKTEKVTFCVMEQPEVVNTGPDPDNLDPYVSFVKVTVSEVA